MAAVTIEDLKPHLNMSAGGDDAELQHVLDSATRLVEELVGPLDPTPVTEVHDAAGPVLVLERSPVHAITGITHDGVTVLPGLYRLNQRAGLVHAVAGRRFAGEYTVTYTAGWDAPPPELRLAVLLIAAQLWETQRVPGRRPAPGQADAVPAGFAVPRRAQELMAPHLKGYLP